MICVDNTATLKEVVNRHGDTLANHEQRLMLVERDTSDLHSKHESICSRVKEHEKSLSNVSKTMIAVQTEVKTTNKILYFIATSIGGYIIKYLLDIILR